MNFLLVLLVCPGWPPDVSVCWAHGLLFVVGAMCSPVYCLPPPILLPLFQLLHLCLPRYPHLSPYLASWCLQSCADPLSYVMCMLIVLFYFIIKNPHSPALESSPHLSHHAPWQFWPKWLERRRHNNDLSTRKYECPWRTWAQHHPNSQWGEFEWAKTKKITAGEFQRLVEFWTPKMQAINENHHTKITTHYLGKSSAVILKQTPAYLVV